MSDEVMKEILDIANDYNMETEELTNMDYIVTYLRNIVNELRKANENFCYAEMRKDKT